MGLEGRPLGGSSSSGQSPDPAGPRAPCIPLPSTVLSYEVSPAASAAGTRKTREPPGAAALPSPWLALCRPGAQGSRAPLCEEGAPSQRAPRRPRPRRWRLGLLPAEGLVPRRGWQCFVCRRLCSVQTVRAQPPGHSPFVDVKPFISLIRVFVIMSHHPLSSLFPPWKLMKNQSFEINHKMNLFQ